MRPCEETAADAAIHYCVGTPKWIATALCASR
jgi:hypothetical protein